MLPADDVRRLLLQPFGALVQCRDPPGEILLRGVQTRFPLVRAGVALVGEPVPLVGDRLSLVGDPVALGGDPIALADGLDVIARRFRSRARAAA